jgi:uncharacterized protein YggE
VLGYFVDRRISFVLHDSKQVAPLIRDVLTAGADSISQVSFETSELRKYKDQARLMALKAAREKAELLSGELHAKLGRPVRIDESPARGYSPWTSAMNSVQNAVQDEGESDLGGSIALGRIPIRASVRTTFELQ